MRGERAAPGDPRQPLAYNCSRVQVPLSMSWALKVPLHKVLQMSECCSIPGHEGTSWYRACGTVMRAGPCLVCPMGSGSPEAVTRHVQTHH